jgi:hypothetical protein
MPWEVSLTYVYKRSGKMGSKEEKEVEHVKPLVNGSKRNDELLIWVTKWTRGGSGMEEKIDPRGVKKSILVLEMEVGLE